MGLRARVIVLCATLVSPAVADVLPVDGAYGNPAGCAFYLYGTPPAGDYVLLTPDTLASGRLSCDFDALLATQNQGFRVDAVCTPGGKMQIEVSNRGPEGYTASAPGGQTIGPAPRCPDEPALPHGILRS